MRLGTRSCLECRRRKVRCIFNGTDKTTCTQCKRHSAVCRPQGGESASPHSRDQDTALLGSGNDGARGTSDAPLLDFLRAALPVASTASPSESRRALEAIPSPRGDIPPWLDAALLLEVLQKTEPFWTVWPFTTTTFQDHLSGFPSNIADADTFVNLVWSHSVGQTAKCYAWLGLCFMQLPRHFTAGTPVQMPLPARELADLYLRHASTLIGEAFQSGSDDIRGIEASAAMYKGLTDLGRPQQAWKCVRRAIDHSLLLGLDRVRGTTPEDRYRHLMWTMLWGWDRKMSLFLGLPYTVPEALISADFGEAGMTVEDTALQDLNVLCGNICDRNREEDTGYSITMRIAEAMDSLRSNIPLKWIEKEEIPTPLNAAFRQRVAVFHFHYVNILLHLPYMLKGKTEDRYRYSHTSILSSAKLVLQAWNNFPSGGDVPVVSGYLDFCAFNAAVILAADLMSTGSGYSLDHERREWNLITETAELMQAKAYVLGCTVSCQSSRLLQTLYAVRNGSYKATGTYEVSVPCLGKITFKGSQRPSHEGIAAISIDFESMTSVLNSAEHDVALELGGDWTDGSLLYDFAK